MEKENPAPLAGGNRAGIGYAEQRSFTGGSLKRQAQQRLRRQHLARQVHHLGPRVLFEFIDELDRHHRLGDDLDRRLEKYASADPDLLRAFGGDRFPPLPTRQIWGRP
jgi:hypothetical protein